jgi:hypothetical protein
MYFMRNAFSDGQRHANMRTKAVPTRWVYHQNRLPVGCSSEARGALRCSDFHGGLRMNFAQLGYAPYPTRAVVPRYSGSQEADVSE